MVKITRVSVDLTQEQRAVVDQMIELDSQIASEAAGIEIALNVRQFFHGVLAAHASELGLSWPANYPTPGGDRSRTPRRSD